MTRRIGLLAWRGLVWLVVAAAVLAPELGLPSTVLVVLLALLQAAIVYATTSSATCAHAGWLLLLLALSDTLMPAMVRAPVPESIQIVLTSVVRIAADIVLGLATLVGVCWRPTPPAQRHT